MHDISFAMLCVLILSVTIDSWQCLSQLLTEKHTTSFIINAETGSGKTLCESNHVCVFKVMDL